METSAARTEAQVVQYTITGDVQPHRGRGRLLGVPTLNIPVTASIPDGVYAGFVLKETHKFSAAIFIGAAITFNETERQAEAHILDGSVDITGRVEFRLTNFIRANQAFSDGESLQNQMQLDIKAIKLCLQA